MSLIQNSQQYHINPSKDTDPQESGSSDCQQPKRDKSIPKFNRRGESRSNQRKKSQLSSNIDHRICYLSPGKTNSGSNFNVTTSIATTSTFQDVKHRFSVNNKDLFAFDPTHFAKGLDCTKPIKKECCEGCQEKIQQRCKEIESLESKIQTLSLQVRLQKEKTEALQIKLQEFQQARTFLLQREGFISQILENNILLNENVMKCEAEKRVMEEHFGVLLQEKLDFQREYERQSQQWAERFKSKNQEIANLISINKKMQIEMDGKVKAKKEKDKAKQQSAFKENLDKGNIAKLAKSKSRDSFNAGKQTTEFSSLDPNIIQDAQLLQKYSFTQSFEDDPHKQTQQKLIKKLQQKIRYSEIEIDVLKKIKEDSSKLTKSNETLKCQNKKLLKRIDYLSRQCNKRSIDSDSSLELSLSPHRS